MIRGDYWCFSVLLVIQCMATRLSPMAATMTSEASGSPTVPQVGVMVMSQIMMGSCMGALHNRSGIRFRQLAAVDYQVDGVGDHDGCYPYWLAPDSDRDEQNEFFCCDHCEMCAGHVDVSNRFRQPGSVVV